MLRLYCVILTVFSLLTANAQEEMTYYLPKTSFRFVLTLEKTKFVPGTYADYADKYYKLGKAKEKATTKTRIINMKIEQLAERDTSKCYQLRVDSKQSLSSVDISSQGCLLGVNMEKGNDERIVADTTFLSAPHRSSSMTVPYTEEMLQATSRARVAKLVASEIYSIREDMQQLMSGQSDSIYDAQQLAVMLKALKERETAFEQLFVGHTEIDTLTEVYDYMPTGAVSKYNIFKVGNTPYYINIDILSHGEGLALADLSEKKTNTGVFVNVPGIAHLSVFKNETLWTELNYYVPQLGRVEKLRPDLFSKKSYTVLQLNKVTGAIKSIETTIVK